MGKDNKRTFNKDSLQINGLLDRGCAFEGKLNFDGIVQINGEFTGEVVSDGTLVVGENASINAKILVDTLIVDGRVEGTVEAKSKIELHSTGSLVANLTTQSLVIEDGGVFQGNCAMAGATETARRSEDLYVAGEEQEAMVM